MAFGYYKVYTVQSGQVPSAQSNYPALLPAAADNDLRTVANGGHGQSASGFDQRPHTSTALTTAMTFELVSYNPSTGEKEMHVLTSSIDTGTVVAYAYGDASVTTDGSSTSTWPSAFKGVWHCGTPSSVGVNDSTSNGYNFTNSNCVAVAGQISGAAQFNGTNGKLSRTGINIPSSGSVSLWWQQPTYPAVSMPFRAANISPARLFDITFTATVMDAGWYNNGNNQRIHTGTLDLVANNYYLLTVAWTSGSVTNLYINGVFRATNAATAVWDTSSALVAMGYDSFGGGYYASTSDELRISDTWTNDQMLTDYRSQSAPASFWSTGSEVAVPGAGGGPIISGGSLTKGALIRGGRIAA